MQLDLDELERRAREATASPYAIDEWDRDNLVHQPQFTLALIARILEDALRMQCDRLDAFHETYTKVAKDPLNLREIHDKGAVLP